MSQPKPKTSSKAPAVAQATKKRKHDAHPDSKGAKSAKNSSSQGQLQKKRKTEELYESSSSKEAHAKQRQLAKTRKLSKPNANEIEQAKKLWGRLRRKSHVPRDERTTLVSELFTLITGRVRDFVFKHDSVRTIQTALKYGTPDQRKAIAKELQGEYRGLVEGRYSKFLVAKILVKGDKETRDMVISEFYGHVRKLINHPEASWIVDDTYRQLATPDQKAKMLLEWYGPEYSMLRTKSTHGKDSVTADLDKILRQEPEKKKPIFTYLLGFINALIQKKMTAFTMLHDAMLQYSLALSPNPDGTPNETINDWITLIRPDEDADLDLLKNLAFTPSGVRVVTRALAFGTAKDRRAFLRAYKDHIETVACDTNAFHVLLAAYEAVDDTKAVSKLIFPDLLAAKTVDQTEREAAIAAMVTHPVGRVALLWPFIAGQDLPKWLVQKGTLTDMTVTETRAIKSAAGTTKKGDETRRRELIEALLSAADVGIYGTITTRAEELAGSSFGCQFVGEILLHAGDATFDTQGKESEKKFKKALEAVADLAKNDPDEGNTIAGSAAGGRMLKTLAQGGPYDPATKSARHVDWLDDFPDMLWTRIKPHALSWATGSESFVVLALAENTHFGGRKELMKELGKYKKELNASAKEGNKGAEMLVGML